MHASQQCGRRADVIPRAALVAMALTAWLLLDASAFGAVTQTISPNAPPSRHAPHLANPTPKPKPKLDESGRKHIGEASIYAKKFVGKTMADGAAMDPHDDNAASKTLPLGTKAKVTNVENGQSAVVTIQDRGPYVKGRIVDLSPSTASAIGIGRKEGVAKVVVTPISVPQRDGSVKPGAAAAPGTQIDKQAGEHAKKR